MANDESSSGSPSGADPASPRIEDLVVDLNFTPTWARSSGENPYVHVDRPERSNRGGRDDRPKRRDRGERGGSGGGRRPRRKPEEGGRDGRPDRRRGQGRSRESTFNPLFKAVEISFLPERDSLGAVVRQLNHARRAFPLPFVAGLFLDKPEHHLVKFEIRSRGRADAGADLIFFETLHDHVLFTSRDEARRHLAQTGLTEMFDLEEVETEPPAGHFVCVGKCRLSGALLGPPNYHEYQERVLEAHRTHASGMSLDDYRNRHVEMVREPEAVEAWKESCRKKQVYRLKGDTEGATLSRLEAERKLMAEQGDKLIRETHRAVIPAKAARAIEDPRLRQVLEAAWSKEDRFPFSMMLALRPALKRMKLHLFKVGKGDTYVTSIPPKPFDADHTIPSIHEMIDLIQAHPGWNRKKLAEELCPGKAMEDADVVERLSPLSWLIEKGHVIEFFNGSLSLPGAGRRTPAGRKEKAESVSSGAVESTERPSNTGETGGTNDVPSPDAGANPVNNPASDPGH